MPSYRLVLNADRLLVLLERARFPLSSPGAVRHMGDAIRQYGAMVQRRAVYNVSGYPVIYDGRVFRVRVQTGALKGSIELEWPYGSVFSCRIYVNGAYTSLPAAPGGYLQKPTPVSKYAGAIEEGHPAIDLKKTMKGKTVPFFGSRSKTPRGPFATGGLRPLVPGAEGFGAEFQSREFNARLAAKGKGPMVFTKRGGGGIRGASSYFIAFRKVGNTGWIIPAAEPRPFMRAAVEGTKDKGRRLIVNAAVAMLKGDQ